MPTFMYQCLAALKKNHRAFLDALVIAAAALKNAGKEEAQIAEQAVRTAANVDNYFQSVIALESYVCFNT